MGCSFPYGEDESAAEQRIEIEGVCHRPVARVAGMKVVAGVEGRIDARRMVGIAQHHIKINDGVEGTALPDPAVDFLTQRILVGMVIVAERRSAEGAFKRGVRVAPMSRILLASASAMSCL